MFFDDEHLVKERAATLSERAKAALRTTRLPAPAMMPGQEPPVIQKAVVPAEDPLQKGLIANKAFEKGEFITSFPLDATTYKDDDGSGKVCYGSGVDMEAVRSSEANVLHDNTSFTHIVSSKGVPVSMALPTVTEECSAYMGHWANDGAVLAGDTPQQTKDYQNASFDAANAAHVLVCDGIFVWTVATKPIAKGEEIFVTLGVPWWQSWRSKNPHVAATTE